MEELIKSVAENLKIAIDFIEKVKVDKKLKSEKEDVLNRLKRSFKRCSDQCEETYNDVDISRDSTGDVYNDVSGEQYDDVVVGKASQTQEPDNVYDDNAADDQNNVYDDNFADSQSESYDDVEVKKIKLIEYEKLAKPVIADYLDQKKEKKLLSGAWQKRWCALHNGILYIYESQKDKQQKDAFEIAGYKFSVRDEITKESKRKERCFELKSERNKKTYEFCAQDKESLSKWEAAFNMKNTGRAASIVEPEETYDDVGNTGNALNADNDLKAKKKGLNIPSLGLFSKKKPKPAEKIEEQEDGGTYEDYDDVGRNTDPPPPQPVEDADQMYEDYEGEVTSPSRQLPPVPRDLPVPPVVRRASAHNELPPIPPMSPMSPMSPNRDEKTGSGSGSFMRNRPPMPLPGEVKELPQPPPIQEDFPPPEELPPPMIDTNPPEENSEFSTEEFDSEDYENLYQGKWDCSPADNNELGFKRGEIVHIISREYESYGWWTAESNDDDVGLVPISYLMKAYDI